MRHKGLRVSLLGVSETHGNDRPLHHRDASCGFRRYAGGRQSNLGSGRFCHTRELHLAAHQDECSASSSSHPKRPTLTTEPVACGQSRGRASRRRAVTPAVTLRPVWSLVRPRNDAMESESSRAITNLSPSAFPTAHRSCSPSLFPSCDPPARRRGIPGCSQRRRWPTCGECTGPRSRLGSARHESIRRVRWRAWASR